MSITSWSKSEIWVPTWAPTVETYYRDSVPSTLRDREGRLILGNNPFRLDHYRCISHFISGKDGSGAYPSPNPTGIVNPVNYATEPLFVSGKTSASNRAYGKFVKNMRQGQGSSLGVTFGTAGQSVGMVRDRASRVSDLITRTIPSLRRIKKMTSRDAASLYLEFIFGWIPLVDDMRDGLTTALLHDPTWDNNTVKGVGSSVVPYSVTGTSAGYDLKDLGKLRTRVTYTARVRVTNPNLWLANKLGLVNSAAVAWDLIPWSFVVGMFGNFNQMIGSMTDTVGCTVLDQSITTTFRWAGIITSTNPIDPRINGWAMYENIQKDRSIGASLAPTFQARLPHMDLGLASMATALLVQKAVKKEPEIRELHKRYLRYNRKPFPPEYSHL